MNFIRKFLLALVAACCIFSVVLTVRTLGFSTRQINVRPLEPIALDRESIIGRLSAAIRYKTISYQEPAGTSVAELLKFHAFLKKSFPLTHATLPKSVVGEFSLLYRWQGRNHSLKPLLLMAHMDVVPVDPATESLWTHPPFAGHIADGYIWGRGAMDDKVGVLGILEAVEYLLASGFQPQRTLYLAFGHDEETGGLNGAAKIAALLRGQQVEFEYILDEGGNITNAIVPGISSPLALIGIAEKGYVSLELAVESPGGHTSIPPRQTAIGVLSSAIHRLALNPFPARLSEATRRLLEFAGPEMSWPNRMLLANLWLFEPLVKHQMARSNLTDATIRTTQAATIFQAGVRDNVLPVKATAVLNLRVLSGDSLSAAVAHVRSVVNDPRVKLTPLPGHTEPSPISEVESSGFTHIARTIRQIYSDTLVAPSLMVAATDAKHFVPLTKNIYRFLPITLGAEDAKRYHGIDERVAVKDYEQAVRFYIQLIRNANT